MSEFDAVRRRLLRLLGGMIAAASVGIGWQMFGRDRRDRMTETAESSLTSTSATNAVSASPPSTVPPTTASPPASSSTSTSTTTTVPIERIEVLCREAWGARPVGDGLVEHTIRQITVHHTAVLLEDPSNAPRQLRGHQVFHQVDRGWPDLAYHYMIDPGGNVYEGRDPRYRGDTATAYDPTGHFLICLEGDFDRQEPTEAALEALEAMLAYAVRHYGVGVSTIAGHRDFASTSCPGAALYPLIAEATLAAAVTQRVEAGVTEVAVICGEVAAGQIAAIERSAP